MLTLTRSTLGEWTIGMFLFWVIERIISPIYHACDHYVVFILTLISKSNVARRTRVCSSASEGCGLSYVLVSKPSHQQWQGRAPMCLVLNVCTLFSGITLGVIVCCISISSSSGMFNRHVSRFHGRLQRAARSVCVLW